MHQTIRDAVVQLTALAQSGELPADEPALRTLVWQIFARHELDGVLYQEDYFAEAFRHVQQVWQDLRTGTTMADAVNHEVVVRRPAGAVAVRVDRVDQTPNGLRYVQLKSGRRGKDDHLSTRIMLYALAAAGGEQQCGEIAIHYTATGETHGARPKTDVLERHTARIDGLLAGIANGRWDPNTGPQCETCPFNLICPV